jgi:hypothetical protein
MAKTYPLDVRSVGDDTYVVMSKGHHDPEAFMAAVRTEGYDWPLGKPKHKWVKAVPCCCGEHSCHYELSDQHRPGWFPATYAWEAYGDDRYEPGASEPRNAGVIVPLEGER